MYDFDDTSGSALLHAYLEGDLDPFQEPRLFSMLAESGELRAEMHDYLLIGNVVAEDSDRLTPGAHLQSNVWSTLGLAAPAAAPVAAVPFWNMRVLGTALLAAVAAVLMTLGALALLDRNTIVAPASTKQIASGAGTASNTSAASNMSTASTTSTASNAGTPSEPTHLSTTTASTSKSNRTDVAPVRERRHTIAHTRSDNAMEENIDTPPAAPRFDRIDDAVTLRTVPPSLRVREAYDPSYSSPMTITHEEAPSEMIDDRKGRVFVELNGLTSSNFPRVTIGEPSNPPFNNINGGVGYLFGNGVQAMIEIGEEPFSQRYRGVENGRGVVYSQKPNLLWGGIAARIDFDEIDLPGGIHPYAKGFAGGTSIGPLFKGTLGLHYLPDTRVDFSLGLEGSLLPYRFQGNWFNSQKVGVTYGLSLLF